MSAKKLTIGGVIVVCIAAIGLFFTRPTVQTNTPQDNLEQSLLIAPETENKYINLTNHYLSKEEYEKAEQAARKAIELYPNDKTSYLHLATILYRRKKDYVQATTLLNKAMELDPQDDWPHILLGHSWVDQQNKTQAAAEYQKAIELNPKRNWGYMYLGRILREQGDVQKAEQLFLQAIKVDPKTTEPDTAYKDLIGLYKEQGRDSEAQELEKVYQKNIQ